MAHAHHALGAKEATARTKSMADFIINEAKTKADVIQTKALEEFEGEKLKVVNTSKDKIKAEFARKIKAEETKMSIKKSTEINRARLEKIKARQDVLAKISKDARRALMEEVKDESKYKPLLTKLMVQGLLMLLESKVAVRCRPQDDALVQGCFGDAAAQYAEKIKALSGQTMSVTLTLDKDKKLPPAPTDVESTAASCLGGVVLTCQGASICIDNTLDSRLGLAQDQAKPAIRKMLFTVE